MRLQQKSFLYCIFFVSQKCKNQNWMNEFKFTLIQKKSWSKNDHIIEKDEEAQNRRNMEASEVTQKSSHPGKTMDYSVFQFIN